MALAGVAAGASAATPSDSLVCLKGAYHEAGAWVQIIPVGRAHAYVHLYFLGGVGHDLINEFEEIMVVRGSALTFTEPPTADDSGCSLIVRRAGRTVAWNAPETAPCSSRANGHAPGIFLKGSIALASRRAVSSTQRYPGEGDGYAATVAEWRKAKPR